MKLLAIDPGTRCGYAVWQDGAILAAGTWDLSPRRFEGGGMRFLRLEGFLVQVLTLYQAAPFDMVAFEEVRRHLGVDAAHVYGGIVATIQRLCESRDPKLPYCGIPVGSVKREATGKGNAKKDAMVAAANARWGLRLTDRDENEADARWIAETAAKAIGRGGQWDVRRVGGVE